MNPFGVDVEGSGSEDTSATSPMVPTLEFGRTHVVRPKGEHQATIVWLHGMGDKGLRYPYSNITGLSELSEWSQDGWSQVFETLPLPNIKWICPTAPTRPVTFFGGFSCTSWFDVEDMSETALDDLEGLDASAVHIANLLSAEPPEVKLGIGGFNMGGALALYSAICLVLGQYRNGNPYPIKLSAVVGLSGWLPCSSTLREWMEASEEAKDRAASLPILLCHGSSDEVVAYEHGERSANTLTTHGFERITFKGYDGLGHYTIPEELQEVCKWLTATMELEGNSSDS